ncbi:MAG: nodulation protein NfeD [Chloroflexi bacterium]|nr:nodulation protein NfeD [Chloroflexota bacterium]
MKPLRIALCVFIALLSLSAHLAHAQTAPHVAIATVDGPIVSVVYDYLNRAIGNAEQDGASALVVQLNTPGGDVSTTLRIIQRFAASRVPIIVYVTPRRAQAASAGTLVTLGAHLAAMAPETVIGAATPISGSGENLNSDARNKAISDLRSTVGTLTRNRPQSAQEWADKAITNAESTTDEKALQLGVIDLIANDLPDLLKQADGRSVKLNGADAKLQTANASTTSAEMSLGESLLYILVSPDIATLLLFVAISGLMIEFQAPGTVVGGIVGAIAFVLFLYSVGTLPVNLTGFVFIVLALILFVFDLHAVQHGALTLGGMASFVIGALILFEPSYVPLSVGLLLGLMAALGALFFFVFRKGYQARRLKPVTGAQGLIGRAATARTDLDPSGTVFVEGERWEATSESGAIHAGERTVITALDGLRLRVKKAE